MRAVTTSRDSAGSSGDPVLQRVPRLGFLGVGWIGLNRMEAIARSGAGEIAMIADPSAEMCAAAANSAGGAQIADSLDVLLDADLDGIVIATPSALHAEQAVRALERGLAVFCQKPLGRTASETRRVVDAARRADLLLGVDFSYRYTAAVRALRDLVSGGALGRVYAADLVFHNAYGPDKAWFRDPRLSGGGCMIDLGIHLVDLALWLLDFPRVDAVDGRLYAGGSLLEPRTETVEDYGIARLELEDGATVRIACSWNLHAGRDAVISAAFHGTNGGATISNVGGSFYDFQAEHHTGTSSTRLASPPDDWGGRAAVDWARRLADGAGFDPEADRLVQVATAMDGVYGR